MSIRCATRQLTPRAQTIHLRLHSQTSCRPQQCVRCLQTSSPIPSVPKRPANFAFAFDIDGVLLRGANPLPNARKALQTLRNNQIPFALLTNGGGKHESTRAADIAELGLPVGIENLIQSHTPFSELVHGNGTPEQPALQDKCILVTGGHADNCRKVAESYGFKNVITPSDINYTNPQIWPFASGKHNGRFLGHHISSTPSPSEKPPLKIDAIFVFNDPRDWALDTQIILDLLLSQGGHLGTLSPKNNDPSFPNRGYLQDSQPPLYYSNPDLWWASSYHLPRLGQGAFIASFKGVWDAVTSSAALPLKAFGKPHQATFEFAERKLHAHRNQLLGLGGGEDDGGAEHRLKNVYMVGDNPASDIQGANNFASPTGAKWHSILVRSGVYSGGEPAHRPTHTVDTVWDAVRWASEKEGLEVD